MKVPNGKQIVVTSETTVISSNVDYAASGLCPLLHKEADTRMTLHVADSACAGHHRVMIRTVDTDVVVLAIAFYHKVDDCHELWLAFGTGKISVTFQPTSCRVP
jgi:aspartate oxidase